ncbi:MAG: hypothetical protein C4346_14235, partial [Chloroflexota bacterium]
MTQTVVVAVTPPALDPQRVAEAALPHARSLAERNNARVELVSVVDLLPKFNPLTHALDCHPVRPLNVLFRKRVTTLSIWQAVSRWVTWKS